MLILVNSSMDASAKITWLLVIGLLPVFGCALYIWTQSEWGRRTLQALVARSEVLSHHLIHSREDTLEQLQQEDPARQAWPATLAPAAASRSTPIPRSPISPRERTNGRRCS